MTYTVTRNILAACEDSADYEAAPGEFWVEFYYRASDGRNFIRCRLDFYSRSRAEAEALAEVEERQQAVGAIVTSNRDARYVRRCGIIPPKCRLREQSR